MTKSKAPVNIPVSQLHPFEGHPFKVLDNEEMNSLIESIQAQGILSPLIVRPLENTESEYEIVSGHRRFHAAQKAGLEKVPAFVYALDRDAAAIALVDSNLHREHILPSEKAFAYRMKYEAMRHQGTSRQVGTKSRTDEQIAENADDSARQIQRYISLTNLIPEILELMDEGKIAFTVGVELSYLDEKSQRDVYEICQSNDCTPSFSQSCRLHKDFNEGELTQETITAVLSEEKANQRETIKIPIEKLKGRIPDSIPAKEREDYILKALYYYNRYRQRQREQER